jgi:mannose-1-phosphate guanylyltransferase
MELKRGMKNNYYALIMAGGVGSRFWPVSTNDSPKQFHDMLGTGFSLLQATFNRLEKIIPRENIFIATNKKYKNLVLNQLKHVSEQQLLLEPVMRNTAPCILYAAKKIQQINPDAIMLVAPSDHSIDDEEEFINTIKPSFNFCKNNDALMTLGIKPSNPNTGYGYIKFEKGDSKFKKVIKFTEKPDLAKANEFLKSGNYLWNAGIFIWSISSILKSYKLCLPEMDELFCKGRNTYNTKNENEFIEINYSDAENISIDYAIMQKAKNIYTLPVDFGWSDLGTWSSLYEKLNKDNFENAVINAEILALDASENMISTSQHKHVIIKGLSDYIIVENNDVIMICPKKDEQEIKQIVNNVKEKFGENLI